MNALLHATRAEHAAGPAVDPLSAARRVLAIEADALRALAASLDGRFAAAVARLAAVDGRVVVSGMGKSGHVGRKIAATLASTGTPAHYVHPAEASHGDLGMITAADAVLALSKSGETPELADMIAYTRRFAIPLVALVADGDSTLARAADIALVLPPVAEACPLGLAPTTSTTLMLALGDALAVALLQRRGFTADTFRTLHPGGKLGAKLVRVRDLMQEGAAVPLVGVSAGMAEAICEMSGKRLGCVGLVAADGRLAGIITDGDLRRNMADGLLKRPARAIMTATPRTIGADALAAEAVAAMNGGERPITVLFVVDGDGRPVGALHLHDCLRAGVV